MLRLSATTKTLLVTFPVTLFTLQMCELGKLNLVNGSAVPPFTDDHDWETCQQPVRV